MSTLEKMKDSFAEMVGQITHKLEMLREGVKEIQRKREKRVDKLVKDVEYARKNSTSTNSIVWDFKIDTDRFEENRDSLCEEIDELEKLMGQIKVGE